MDRRLIVITGASSGIGEAFARRLAPGHDLLLIARRQDRLHALAEEFHNKFGTHTEVRAADLTDSVDLDAVTDELRARSDIALLVNNAGFGTKGRFWETDLYSQEQMIKLHITAPTKLTHAVLSGMVRDDFGAIVNVSSVSSFVRSSGAASYSASKAWMTAFTEGLCVELRGVRSSVTMQALCPGFTYSEFHSAMGLSRHRRGGPAWWLTAEEVVEASLDGLRRRKLIVVPGWRYKLLTSLVSKLPIGVKTALEAAAGRSRHRELPVQVKPSKEIPE